MLAKLPKSTFIIINLSYHVELRMCLYCFAQSVLVNFISPKTDPAAITDILCIMDIIKHPMSCIGKIYLAAFLPDKIIIMFLILSTCMNSLHSYKFQANQTFLQTTTSNAILI